MAKEKGMGKHAGGMGKMGKSHSGGALGKKMAGGSFSIGRGKKSMKGIASPAK